MNTLVDINGQLIPFKELRERAAASRDIHGPDSFAFTTAVVESLLDALEFIMDKNRELIEKAAVEETAVPKHNHGRPLQIANIYSLQKMVSAMHGMCSGDSIIARAANAGDVGKEIESMREYLGMDSSASQKAIIEASIAEAVHICSVVGPALEIIRV